MTLTEFSEEYSVGNSLTDPDLDSLMQLAGRICDRPFVLLSLREGSRILAWSEDDHFCSSVRITPEFRTQVLFSEKFLCFSEAEDPAHYLMGVSWSEEKPIRFYVGTPIITREGRHLGTLSVLDFKSDILTEVARNHLQALAGQVALVLSHRSSEAELRQVVQRQRLVVDGIPAMIAYWSSEERCLFANKAYFEWFGFTPEYLYGRTMKELLGEVLYEKNSPYIRGALKGIPQFFERDLTRKAHGDLRHTQAHYIPDLSNGEVRGFFVLVADVTDRKHAEREALHAREVAVSALKVKSRFLANMSHEIRSPMNGILGMLNLALETPLNTDQKEYLVAAKQSADHLLTVISDILDLSKIEAGKMTLRDENFCLREMVISALRALLINAERKGIETEIFIDERIPQIIRSDSVRLRQVLLNLFGNALKFTSAGKVVLRVILENQGEQFIRFEVADTGIGIPAEELELIFSPFRQSEKSGARSFGGTGLGLAISKELVEMMGGKLGVESVPGFGSKFHFTVHYKPTSLDIKSSDGVVLD